MSASLCTPWRSVWVPRAVTAIALAVGVPLFLRMPPWCDITLYQMAARNLLRGGVHYRDLFDTNMPGFVWAMTAISAAFGPSVIALRVVDLLVVAGVVALIDRVATWGGASPVARWWAVAGAAAFYPFTVEMSHAQRDLWMALPGLAAVALRLRRAVRDGPPPAPFWPSFAEGLFWGAGVWIKPHVALMALAVWVLTARRLAGEHPRPWRAAGRDLLGNVLGGLAVAAPGVAWMVATGTWEPFYTVFTQWNPLYMKLARSEFHWRVEQELFWFPPWSMGLVLTVPLALLSVLDAAPWSTRARAAARPTGWLGRWLPRLLWDKQAGSDARLVRGAFGGLYLVWAAQAFLVQRGFQYVHVPETLLMFGLWAMHRWAWVPLGLVWLAATSGAWIVADYSPGAREYLNGLSAETRRDYLPRHPLTDAGRLALWPDCWRFEMSDAERYALWDELRLHPPHEASIGWEELAEVADYLRKQGVKDREVVAWFDSPHAVYVLLDIEPGIRYMHVYTVLAISMGDDGTVIAGRGRVMHEMREAEKGGPKIRYAVSDLEWGTLVVGSGPEQRAALYGPGRNPPHDLLPAATPFSYEFPFNQPTVFRSRNGTGRYIVHRVVTLTDDPEP